MLLLTKSMIAKQRIKGLINFFNKAIDNSIQCVQLNHVSYHQCNVKSAHIHYNAASPIQILLQGVTSSFINESI